MSLFTLPVLRFPHLSLLSRQAFVTLSPRRTGGDAEGRGESGVISAAVRSYLLQLGGTPLYRSATSPPAGRGEMKGQISQQSARVLTLLLRGYQRLLSPFFAALGSQCRFEPSCSQYMIDAVELRGPLVGLALGVWRMLRCNPFNPGGYDPAPSCSSRRRRLTAHGDECRT